MVKYNTVTLTAYYYDKFDNRIVFSVKFRTEAEAEAYLRKNPAVTMIDLV